MGSLVCEVNMQLVTDELWQFYSHIHTHHLSLSHSIILSLFYFILFNNQSGRIGIKCKHYSIDCMMYHRPTTTSSSSLISNQQQPVNQPQHQPTTISLLSFSLSVPYKPYIHTLHYIKPYFLLLHKKKHTKALSQYWCNVCVKKKNYY